MPGLTVSELAEFLGEPGHLLRLGTIGTDGLPRVVPIWVATPAVCCTIDESDGLLRKLVARGTAHLAFDLGDDPGLRPALGSSR